jgi:23S rRNA (uracil1939-C5)-methyltransferase
VHPQSNITRSQLRIRHVPELQDLLRFTELVHAEGLHGARVSQRSRHTGFVELTATRVVAGGDALARAADGRVTLVDGALPGERVRVEITAEHPDHLRARVIEVLDASPDRVIPPCVYAREGCGGCGWQHVAAAAQPSLKVEIIRDALARIAHLDDPPFAPPVVLPPTGFRTTVRALVVDGRPAFRRHHSHDPVGVDTCLVAHPVLDELLREGHFGRAREVTLRVGAATGERAARADPAGAKLDLPPDVEQGASAHVHEVIAGRPLRVSINAFFQSRADGAEALVGIVRDAVGRDRTIVDLYSGVGLFAATVDEPRRVIAVERGRAAIADAKHNLRGLPARVVGADVGRWKGTPADVVIADPSRTGLGKDGARTVIACDADRVVLVSCDAASLARDVALLARADYTPVSVTLVDLFAHTPHIECVTVLGR